MVIGFIDLFHDFILYIILCSLNIYVEVQISNNNSNIERCKQTNKQTNKQRG